jgi:hypothetical protein
MPKVCPKCQAVNGGFVVRCSCGFDLSNIQAFGLLGDAPTAPGPSPARLGWPGFFLRAGQLLALLGCAGSLLGVPLATQLSPRSADLAGVITLALLGAVVGFFYWAAMFVVFTEVLRLRGERASVAPGSAPSPPPQSEQTGAVRSGATGLEPAAAADRPRD